MSEKQKGLHGDGEMMMVLGKVVEAQWMREVKNMILQEQRENLRRAQQNGIRKALKRKAEGRGAYGRPKTKLPKDFKKQILQRKERHEKLAEYCRELEMRPSTFYRWVRRYEEEEQVGG